MFSTRKKLIKVWNNLWYDYVNYVLTQTRKGNSTPVCVLCWSDMQDVFQKEEILQRFSCKEDILFLFFFSKEMLIIGILIVNQLNNSLHYLAISLTGNKLCSLKHHKHVCRLVGPHSLKILTLTNTWSESESALFAKCAQTYEEFFVVFKKLLLHTRIHIWHENRNS